MKKQILALMLAGLSCYTANATKRIYTFETNGGPKGYKDRTESHNTLNDTHSLNCDGPGDKACVWTENPWTSNVMTQTREMINLQVDGGVLSGTQIMHDETGTAYSVEWNASGTGDLNFTIEQ
jgi:hypothetical protein